MPMERAGFGVVFSCRGGDEEVPAGYASDTCSRAISIDTACIIYNSTKEIT